MHSPRPAWGDNDNQKSTPFTDVDFFILYGFLGEGSFFEFASKELQTIAFFEE